jgi:hypothetical protein
LSNDHADQRTHARVIPIIGPSPATSHHNAAAFYDEVTPVLRKIRLATLVAFIRV